jgi:hypothetical protein
MLGGLVLALAISVLPPPGQAASPPTQRGPCQGEFQPVSPALTDLAGQPYVRMDGTVTAAVGGLYPGGRNTRPAAHEAAGLALARQVAPLNSAGEPDPAGGRIVLLAIGMSNTALEFRAFRDRALADPTVNSQLQLVSGAAAAQTAETWLDPAASNWEAVAGRLRHERVTPAQVQVAWVKLTRTMGGDFPGKAEQLRDDLATVARNLRRHYPNLKLVYLSSRTRAYQYWEGLSPEPAAFETGFAVRWLIEQQLAGDPSLNFDPQRGPVVSPWLAWGPYLWVDGENTRSDGAAWTTADLIEDCTHPSESGIAKVADQLMAFFKTDSTTRNWFLAEGAGNPQPAPAATATPSATVSPPAPPTPAPGPGCRLKPRQRACAF